MFVSAFRVRLRQHLTHLCGNFSQVLQRKKQKGTDLEIKRESIIRFCNFLHFISDLQRLNFLFPEDYFPDTPSDRAILC